jgi:hypothetical protein
MAFTGVLDTTCSMYVSLDRDHVASWAHGYPSLILIYFIFVFTRLLVWMKGWDGGRFKRVGMDIVILYSEAPRPRFLLFCGGEGEAMGRTLAYRPRCIIS